MVTEPAEPGGDEDLGSDDASVDLAMPTPTYVGDQGQVDRLASIDQQQAPAARRAPSGRQPSGDRAAPTDRPAHPTRSPRRETTSRAEERASFQPRDRYGGLDSTTGPGAGNRSGSAAGLCSDGEARTAARPGETRRGRAGQASTSPGRKRHPRPQGRRLRRR